MLSRKLNAFLSRSAVAQLGMLVRDGSHIGHECSGILARGVTFGHPAGSGIRRLGSQTKRFTALQAASPHLMTLAPAAD